MKKFLSAIREKFSGPSYNEVEQEDGYVELDTVSADMKSKVVVRPCVLNEYDEIKDVLNILREGKTIVLLNIAPLKEKDIVELKRAINKLKKTIEAVNGEVAGFGDDYIIACPSFAAIYRQGSSPSPSPKVESSGGSSRMERY